MANGSDGTGGAWFINMVRWLWDAAMRRETKPVRRARAQAKPNRDAVYFANSKNRTLTCYVRNCYTARQVLLPVRSIQLSPRRMPYILPKAWGIRERKA